MTLGAVVAAPRRGPKAVAVLGVLAAALGLRLVFFGGLLAEDDGLYWQTAHGLRTGHYAGFPYITRHGVVVPLAIVQGWFGENEYAAAVVTLAYSLGGVALAYGLGALSGGHTVGLVAAGLLAVLPLDVIAATDFHRDLPLATLLAAAFYALKRGELAPRSASMWFALSGLTLALAYVTKELAIVFAAAFIVPWVWRRRSWRDLGWLASVFGAVLLADALWSWRALGDAWFRYSPAVVHDVYVTEGRRLSAASSTWMFGYPSMLLNPLGGYFGYLAGIFYLVLAASLWGRRDPAVRELALWWLPPLVVLSVLPVDATFTRPAAPHFPRYLHPFLVPFVVTAALWVVRGLSGHRVVRAGILTAYAAAAGVGIALAHFDYRIWAAPERQVAAWMAHLPADAVVATDPISAWLLRALAPDRGDRVVLFADVDLAAPRRPTFVLRDPPLLFADTGHPPQIPRDVTSPPASWTVVAQFPRPTRPRLRAAILGWLGIPQRTASAPTPDPAVLWRVDPRSGPAASP